MTYNILHEDCDKFFIECLTCGRKFYYSKENVYKFKHSEHGYCGRLMHQEIRDLYGIDVERLFFSKMRAAKNRVTNPNNKDYKEYSKYGWGYKDAFDFTNNELLHFVSAVEEFNTTTLSIDRINGRLGYTPSNIRFVPMSINLQNKDKIREVISIDLESGEQCVWKSTKQCAEGLGIPYYSRVYDCCNRDNHVYKNKYIFMYA